MYSKEIFEQYGVKQDGKLIANPFYEVHARNQEGMEDQFAKFLPPDRLVKILDVGCGWGQLLYMLKSKGYNNIKGVDLGPEQAAATRKLGIDAEQIPDLASYLSTCAGAWDVIILSQVIEHFPKDRLLEYLKMLRKALKQNGMILIATPNMALASGPVQRYTDFTHEVGFTERSIEQVLRVSGYSDIKVYGEEVRLRLRPKFLVWWALRNIWFCVLGFIYLLEKGSDRPRLISRHLIAIARNQPGNKQG